MFSFTRWREKYGKLTIHSLWDLFMVWVVIINLTLILFDLSYLWLRPIYFKHLPIVTRIYDPVLGIRPHPLTDGLIDRAVEAEKLLTLDPTAPALDDLLFELETLTTRVFLEDPFLRSGQTENLAAIWTAMARETGKTVSSTKNPDIVAEVARDFWSGPPELLRHRFALFDQQIEPRLAVNYFRGFNLDGRLIDNFWKIDLPFLILFWIEFVVRWVLAITRRTHARWYFFPIFHWYDLLSLIPVTALRPLRLLRVVSIYMRLRQSDLSRVGRDFLSRAVAYISNIITEVELEQVAESLDCLFVGQDGPDLADQDALDLLPPWLDGRSRDPHMGAVDDLLAVFVEDSHRHPIRYLLGDDVGDVGHGAAEEIPADP
jgi:hypothetical protein